MYRVVPESNYAQKQSITLVLRGIIKEYYAGGGVLRELCQNADDAGASEIEFVLDCNQHPTQDILHEGLAEYQGVSLLAFNDKKFSQADFDSLSRVGDSAKVKDPSTTGKFGRGFNSVYNWTDSPSILSGCSLLILDPHHSWSASPEVANPGGPLYNFVRNREAPQMKNQLSAFKSLLKDLDSEFDGTIIRIPLRTQAQAAKSEIVVPGSEKHTTAEDIIDVFHRFSDELVETLLYLRNLRSIKLRVGDKIYAKAASATCLPSNIGGKRNKNQQKKDINKSYREVFVKKIAELRKIDFLMNISVYCCYIEKDPKIEKKQNFKYAISHQLRKDPGDHELQRWARSQKLFPWVAIATPLEGSTNFNGRLFSTLPLPVKTKHPVHIHGMFSITPDRQSIHFGGDKINSKDSEAWWGTKWNDWLFQECVPQTWVQNLDFLRTMNERDECLFGGWEFWPVGSVGGWKEIGMGVLGGVFKEVLKRNLKLLPTVCGTTGTRETVLFAIEVEDELKRAFRDARVPVVHPPQNRQKELAILEPCSLGLTAMTPSTARRYLTALRSSLSDLPIDSRMLLLHYVISDEDFRDIGSCAAPLIPVKDGTFQAFRRPTNKLSTLFLSRDGREDVIFEKYTETVDLTTTLPRSKKLIQKNIFKLDKFTAVRMRRPEDAALYCFNHVFNNLGPTSMPDIINRDGIVSFVDEFWHWINQHCKPLTSVANSPLRDLWLLPLMAGEYRKLSSTITVLDVSARRGIGLFLWATANSHFMRNQRKYCLFTGEGFSPIVSKSLHECGFVKSDEDIVSLMKWLVENARGFVDELNDGEKISLLQHLSALSRNYMGGAGRKAMQDGISKLSLFQEAVPLGTSKGPWISLDLAVSQNPPVNYVGIKNVPVALKANNTIFIDTSDSDTRIILTGLKLVTCTHLTETLERYVVPRIAAAGDENSRNSLVNYALQNFDSLSMKSKEELSKTEFVPVATGLGQVLLKCPGDTVAPNSAVASLFFQNENKIPIEEFYRSYRSKLLELGMVNGITDDVVLERISEYGNSNHPQKDVAEKVQFLIANCQNPPEISQEILDSLCWIPARMLGGTQGLYTAKDCRDRSFEMLVKYAMPLAYFPVNNAWTTRFRWNQKLPTATLLKQLEGAAKAEDNTALEYLIKHKYIGPDQHIELKQIPWIPSAAGGYYVPTKIFFDDFRALSPHFGTVDNRFKGIAGPLFIKLGVQNAPSFQQLKELQDELASIKAPLIQKDLDKALFIVKEVGERYPKIDLTRFKAPDNTGHFHFILELTAGDPGSTETNDLKILHQAISLDTAKRLKLATFKDRFLQLLNDPDFEEDFSQRESPMAVIEDTLKRYPISNTFNEYLANAEDSGSASKVCWILDESEDYPKTNLLSQKLAEVQGPALFCYNDGRFSENDFKGIIDIGVGSKRDDPSKIGKFGKGALTMYHWTSIPSFISGEYYVIFDPEKKYLPEHPVTQRPRAGMKIKIEHVREQWPEQLRPFEGILKFDKDSKSFPGTIFRFPLPRCEKPHMKAKIGTSEARRYLEHYFEEANISLLFLKEVSSISFWDKGSKKPNWGIWSKTNPIPGEPDITYMTIYNRPPRQISDIESKKPIPRLWCIVSGKIVDVPNSLIEIQKKERLETSYGLAALLSEIPIGGFSARHFVGLPLQNSTILGIPVHVNADTIIRSNRQSISIEQKDEGSGWNGWIFKNGVAQGYLYLVKHLMLIRGIDGYRHWPEHQSGTANTASKIIATAFWELVVSSSFHLYPPMRLTSTTNDSGNGHTLENLCLNDAVFNLLGPIESDFLLPILSEFGIENIIRPSDMVRNALSELLPKSITSITPIFLLNLLGSSSGSKRLVEIWGQQHNFNIDFFNKLLSFIIQETTQSSLVGKTILPLANYTLGTLSQVEHCTDFLVATTPEETEILGIFQALMVHPGLARSTVDRLVSPGTLNVAKFCFDDISRLRPAFEKSGTEFRKTWLEKVWRYMKRDPRYQRDIGSRVDRLQHIPIYFGKVVGEHTENCVFICPLDFRSFTHPAILEPLETTTKERLALESLAGIIMLDRSAFPDSGLRQESIRTSAGIYRLLKCIDHLAAKNGLFIEEYITRNVPAGHIATLRAMFTPAIISEILNQYPSAKEYLKQLPIWPVSDVSSSKTIVHQPATKTLLPPYAILSSLGMTQTSIFIETSVATHYGNQLEQLGVGKMSLGVFLRDHVGICSDQKLSSEKKSRYRTLLGNLFSVFPHAFSVYPLAVDGNGRFKMASSLYRFDEPIFEAAFRDLEATHFIHADYRSLIGWKNLPLLQSINENSYLACARSIQRRGSDMGGVQDQLMVDARTVFEHICWDSREIQSWTADIWRDLARTSFAPIKTSFTDHHSHRILQMQELVGSTKLRRITETIISDYAHIAWSQFPVLERSPSMLALRKLPSGCIPSSTVVLNHLIFLSNNRFKVEKEQVPAYVTDIKATYLYLQNTAEIDGRFSVLVMPEAEIWFNAETDDILTMSINAFQNSWTSSKNLCIGLEYDSLPVQQVHTFLTPFRDLLLSCGVKRIRPPVIPPSLDTSTIDHKSLMVRGLNRLREEGQSFDVKLVVDGQIFKAHWTVLSAISRYFDGMYTSGMQEVAERTITFPTESEIQPRTVSVLLDYIYSGKVPEAESSGNVSNDLDDIIEQLYTANLWQLDELKNILEHVLCNNKWIRPETVRAILKCAEEVRAEVLVRVCSQYISDNEEIVQRQDTDENDW